MDGGFNPGEFRSGMAEDPDFHLEFCQIAGAQHPDVARLSLRVQEANDRHADPQSHHDPMQ